jgi:hypothetical protein
VHLFAAVRPSTGQGFALVLPEATTRTMQVFLDQFAATLDDDEHAVMVLDQEAGTAPTLSSCPAPSPSCPCRHMRRS